MDTAGLPLPPEKAKEAVELFEQEKELQGYYNRICLYCGDVVGSRLAKYGEPDVSSSFCPSCYGWLKKKLVEAGQKYDGKEHIRVVYVPPQK